MTSQRSQNIRSRLENITETHKVDKSQVIAKKMVRNFAHFKSNSSIKNPFNKETPSIIDLFTTRRIFGCFPTTNVDTNLQFQYKQILTSRVFYLLFQFIKEISDENSLAKLSCLHFSLDFSLLRAFNYANRHTNQAFSDLSSQQKKRLT